MSSLLQSRQQRGASALEAIVAFTLLSTVLTFATPLVVRHSRLLKAQQHYRLALDELSNQLDRITALPESEVDKAVEKIAPSPFIVEHLGGVQLRGEVHADELGKRVQLRIWWEEANRSAAPLVLSAWHRGER